MSDSRVRRLPLLMLAALAVWGLPPAASAESNIADLEAIENAFIALAEKVSPSVVAISTKNAPRSRGAALLSEVIRGVQFVDGIKEQAA